MKITINESQLRLINENFNTEGEVSHEMKTSIALWCLLNDFRYFNPYRIFGSGPSLANSSSINKEICADIMDSYSVVEANDERKNFDTYYDDDGYEPECNFYKVYTSGGKYFVVEVDSDLEENYGEWKLQDYEDGYEDNELIGWFYNTYR